MKSLLLAAALTAAAGTAFAYTPENATGKAAPMPHVVPTSVVQPTGLPLAFANTTIDVEFSLDKAGQPHDIKVLWVTDPVLKRQLVDAFRQWRFEPTVKDADTTHRFVLPVHLNPEA